MRIRTIKPDFWQHRMHRRIGVESALVALALLNYADDEGRFDADAELFGAVCFPLRRQLDLERAFTELAACEFIVLYESSCGNGEVRRFGAIPGFRAHQVIKKPGVSKLPAPPADKVAPGVQADMLPEVPEHRQAFVKPTSEEVTGYAKELGFDLDGQAFCDYYESKGWRIGNTPMKSWQAAVRTWKRKQEAGPKPGALPAAKSKSGWLIKEQIKEVDETLASLDSLHSFAHESNRTKYPEDWARYRELVERRNALRKELVEATH